MSGPMTEPREALATSICSTFDMGHHHHEAFLQPDHCDDGLSDADELLRSLRAQGYSVARSEGPGLDAPSLDEGLRAAAQAVVDQADPDDDPEGQYIDREALTDRLQEAILDLDSRQLMAEAQGYSSAEWRRWTAREIAEDLARQVARSEGPELDAPSLDEGLLARAMHEAKKVGGPWHPCQTRDAQGNIVPVGFGEDPEGDFACLCREMTADIAAEYRRLAQEGETP